MFLNWRFSIVCTLFVPLLFHSALFNAEVLDGIIIGVPAGVATFYVIEVLVSTFVPTD